MTAASTLRFESERFKELVCDEACTDVCFVASDSLLLAGLIDGSACVWQASSGERLWTCAPPAHGNASIRVCTADSRQNAPVVGFSNGVVSILDIELARFTWSMQLGRKRVTDGISAAAFIPVGLAGGSHAANVLACGTDSGAVYFVDTRQSGASNPVLSFHKQNDYIADLCSTNCSGQPATPDGCLLCASGDGSLAVYDCRLGSDGIQATVRALCTASNDELLAVAVLDREQRVVCGTQRGFLDVVRWGRWDRLAYRLRVHPTTVNALLPLDANRVLTGADDGMIRLVPIHPKAIAEIVGESFECMPIEALSASATNQLVACCGHSEVIRVWNLEGTTQTETDESEETDEHAGACDFDDAIEEASAAGSKSSSKHALETTRSRPQPVHNSRRARKRSAASDSFFSELL
ncbi:hypothetical protein CCYA_CCYA11G3041 [Cyanidiococcus yangmingshanensis]|nr:hypothetical protein CCYA_CCYA11G3041 [Cyanidiococcus yangmingshanensis]